jgi:hypothetical protein
MAGFRIFGAIEKVEAQDDGTLLVSGIASTPTKDSQGDILPAETMKAAIPDYMRFGAVREMHQPIAAGTAMSLVVDEEGITRMEALVVDPVTIKKVQTGVLKGFSIGGGIPKDGGRDAKNKRIIRKLHLTEISLVDRPANPEAVITLAKFDSAEEGPMATEQNPAPEGETNITPEPVVKGMYDVERFASLLSSIAGLASCSASEAGWEGDSSPIPEKLRGWLSAGAGIFQEMAAEEVAELIASLNKQMGVAESVTAAAKAAGQDEEDESLEKGRFNKTTKAAIKGLRKAMSEASECLKAFDGLDEDEDTEKVAKAELVEAQESVTKLQGEKADLEEKLAKAEGDLATTKADLDLLDAEAKKLIAKLQTKGSLKVVAVEKSADTGGGEPVKKSQEEGAEAEPTTALEAIKKAHAAGGRPVINRTR